MLAFLALTGCTSRPAPEPAPSPSAIPDVAEIICTAGGAVGPRQVRARETGVHLSITSTVEPTNPDEYFLLVQYPGRLDAMEGDSWGTGIPPTGTLDAIAPAPPGLMRVGCYQPVDGYFSVSDIREDEVAEIEVIDPVGAYRAPKLDCEHRDLTGSLVLDAASDFGEELRENLSGDRTADMIGEVGYPEFSRFSLYGVIREGELIARVRIHHPAVGYRPFSGETCKNSGLTGTFQLPDR
jgi:hypothetical protein